MNPEKWLRQGSWATARSLLYIAKSALVVEVTHECFRYVLQPNDAVALEFEVSLTKMYATSCSRELCYATVGAIRKALSSP